MEYKWWPAAYMDKKPADLSPELLKVIEVMNRAIEEANENRLKQEAGEGA